MNAKSDESAAALLSTHLSMGLGKRDLAEKLAPGVNNNDNPLLEMVTDFREAVKAGDIPPKGLSRTELADLRTPEDRLTGRA